MTKHKPIPTLTPQQECAFWARVAVDMYDSDACWPWKGPKNRGGYGLIKIDGVSYRVHRIAYANVRGPIPDGLTLDHLCRTRDCCNPAHLDPVTSRENTLRGNGITATQAQQTHCKRGHELVGANLRVVKKGRQCRQCSRDLARERLRQLRKHTPAGKPGFAVGDPRAVEAGRRSALARKRRHG
jgi:hypothetical protein